MVNGDLDAEFVIFNPVELPLIYTPVRHFTRVVVMAASHRLAGRRSLRFAEIADETWPGHHPSVPEAWSDYFWMTARRGRRPRVTSDTAITPDEIWPIVASGRAITTAPDYLVDSVIVPTGLVAVPLVDVEPFTIWLARQRQEDNPLLRAFVHHAERATGREPRAGAARDATAQT